MSTSESSETESSIEAESPSEEVAVQLANLEERVGVFIPVTVQMAFEQLFASVHFNLIGSLMAGFAVESCQRPAEETCPRAPAETEEERQVEKGKESQREGHRSTKTQVIKVQIYCRKSQPQDLYFVSKLHLIWFICHTNVKLSIPHVQTLTLDVSFVRLGMATDTVFMGYL